MKNLRSLTALTALCIMSCACAIPFVSLVAFTGCKSPTVQRQAVNTLYSVHKSVDAAFDSYLDLVVKQIISAKHVLKVVNAYDDFQNVYNSALIVVASNTNSVAPQEVMDAAAKFG